MEDNSKNSPEKQHHAQTGRLIFGLVTGTALGAVMGIYFHKKFPKPGIMLADFLSALDSTGGIALAELSLASNGMIESEISRRMGLFAMSATTGGLAGIAGLLIADKSAKKSI